MASSSAPKWWPTFGDSDDVAYFNYTDYEHNALRMFRAALSASWRPAEPRHLRRRGPHRGLRSSCGPTPPTCASGRGVDHAFDIQAGRIPPTFGAFSRRAYSDDNPLIGYPLAYQYLTSLRPDAVPGDRRRPVRMRARGWRSNFTGRQSRAGARRAARHARFRWDTGVQVTLAGAECSTSPARSPPARCPIRASRDDNGGKQLSGARRAHAGDRTDRRRVGRARRLALVARGHCACSPTGADSFPQTRSVGADVEYSRDHWLVRAEAVLQPVADAVRATPARRPIPCTRWRLALEGRYTFTPRIYVAAPGRSSGVLRTAGAADPNRRWDGAGDPRRGRRSAIPCSATSSARIGGPGQRPRRRAGAGAASLAAQLAYWF